MSMRKQKWILICIAILLLLGIAGIIAYNVFRTEETILDAAIEDYDEDYTLMKLAEPDEFMNIDGVLDEEEWSDKQAFTNYFSDDFTMTGPNIEMITHLTEKGLYVGVNIHDTNVVNNGYLAQRKNSTLELNIAPGTADDTTDVHRVYMDARQIVSTTNANVASCAYGVKVDGEVNSGETEKMTMELFIPWKALDMRTPENLETAEMLLNPCYNAIYKGETTSRQLRAFPYSQTNYETFWRFSNIGYVDADATDAVIGNSKNGIAKLGVWDVDGVTLNTSKSSDYTQVYKGTAETIDSIYNLAYLKNASASSYAFEATIVPVSSQDDSGYDAWACLSAVLPGNKIMSLRLGIGKNYIDKNAKGQSNLTTVEVKQAYYDYNNYVGDTKTIANYENTNFETQEGVKLKLIKNGANYYFYVDGVLSWSGRESRADGQAMIAFFSKKCEVEYKNIRWTSYDGREEALLDDFASSNTCLIETEVQGSGEISSDVIAVTKGDSATITVSAMEGNILTDLLINGKSVMSDFKNNAFFEGIKNKYTIQNITKHITVTAVFEQYEGVSVSGKVSIKGESSSDDISSTLIAAYLTDNRIVTFSSAVKTDGTYEISLPKGSYKKIYFMGVRYEQIFYSFSNGSALKVGSKALTNRNFVLTYPTFESFVKGATIETGNWYIVDNCKYTVVAPDGANDYSTAYFRKSDSDDFVVKATVIPTETGAMVGAMIYGDYNGHSGYQMLVGFQCEGSYSTTLFGWHATARPVNWIGTSQREFKNNTVVYPENQEYDLIIAKKGDSIMLCANGVVVKEWTGKVKDYDGKEFDLSKFKPTKVGLSIRGTKGATFSNYSYTSKAADVTNVFCRKVTFSNLPSGVTVTSKGKAISSGTMVRYGTDVVVKLPTTAGKVYAVTVNGEPIPVAVTKGEATFEITEASEIRVTVKSAYSVSGTIAGKVNGSVTATNTTTGEVYIYDGVLKKGLYSVSVPNGTYKLYFDCGNRDGMIAGVTIDGKAVTGQDLDKTYQKLTYDYMGSKPTETSGLIDNGVYYLSGVGNGNSNSIAYFNSTSNPVNDFVISTRVQTDGGEVGIMMYGYDGDKTNPDVQININKNGLIRFYGWGIGWQEGTKISASKYNLKDYKLTVVRKGNMINVYVDDTLVHTWEGTGNVDISQLTDLRVGLLVRGKKSATYSDYYMSTSAADINKVLNRTVTFSNLPFGVSVYADGKKISSGASVLYGTEITVNCPVSSNKVYIVTVNGNPITVTDGKAKFELTSDVQITVTAERAYKVSGTVAEKVSGSILATETTAGYMFEYDDAIDEDGSYEINLPDGTYKLYFDCGSRDGLISAVTVSGEAVAEQNLDKTYQKLTDEYMGSTPNETSELVDNGVYFLSGVGNGNANAIAYFNSSANPVNDFMISTRVQTDGGQVGIMMYGYDGNVDNPDVQINISKNGTIRFYGWGISWQDTAKLDTSKYNPSDFELTVIRNGSKIYVFIDGILMHTWDGTGNVNIAQLTDLKVGLLVRGAIGATYSDYYMTTSAEEISNALNRKVTFDNLPMGVTVSADGATVTSGTSVFYGTEISINCPIVSDKIYSVTVNGKAVSIENGTATFTMTEDATIEVFVRDVYQVSGTVTGEAGGSITATDTVTDEVLKFANVIKEDGSYEINLPNGTYKLYFDCGDMEGVLPEVTVTDVVVKEQNLAKTYQKMTLVKTGQTAEIPWILTDNGQYTVDTDWQNVNTITMGCFDTVDFATTDFVMKTKVKADGNQNIIIGLALSGTLNGETESAVLGWMNGNTTTVRAYSMTYGWGARKFAPTAENRKDFELTIVKQGNSLTYYVDDVQYAQWDLSRINYVTGGAGAETVTATCDYSTMTNVKIGFGLYRADNVVFSDYSYSTDAADISNAMNRSITFGELPEGVTVSAGSNVIASGDAVSYGTEVTVSGLTNTEMTYAVTVNGKAVAIENGNATFVVTKDVELEITAIIYKYAVSGTVGGVTGGNITATETTTGDVFSFTNAIHEDGSYEINLPDGTYKLYFDCNKTEGLITNVIVSGADVTGQNLKKTYQKLTVEYMGSTAMETSGLRDNGVYHLSGVNNGNANAIAYFNSASEPVNNFLISARIQNGSQVGIMMYGYDGNTSNPDVLIHLNPSHKLRFYGWGISWKGEVVFDTSEWDSNDFILTVYRQGATIQIYIDGQLMHTYTNDNAGIELSKLTDLRVGLMVRGTIGATYSNYCMLIDQTEIAEFLASREYKVSGTVSGVTSGTITATNTSTNEEYVFENAIAEDGSYSLYLQNGTYKLYFDCGTTEGMIPTVTVADKVVAGQNLAKTYQKMTLVKMGGTAEIPWILTDNGQYTVDTDWQNVNTITMGCFDTVDFATTDFVMKTKVKADGNQNIIIGLALNGTLNGETESAVLGWMNGNTTTIRAYSMKYSWGARQFAPTADNRKDFNLTIVKKGDILTYYVDNVQYAQWDLSQIKYVTGSAGAEKVTATCDYSAMTNVKIGFGLYRADNVTFSEYSYSTDAEDIENALGSTNTLVYRLTTLLRSIF